MMCNGKAVPNDIEMIIRAFEENTWQYYVPRFDSGIIWDTDQIISTAIKEPQIYIEESTGKEYTWDKINKCFV